MRLLFSLIAFAVIYLVLAAPDGPCDGPGSDDFLCRRCVKIGRRGGCSACEASSFCMWTLSEADPTRGICLEKSSLRLDGLNDDSFYGSKWEHKPYLCPLNARHEPTLPLTDPVDIHVQTLWSHRQEDVPDLRSFCEFPHDNYFVDRFAHTQFDYTNPIIDSRGNSQSACYAVQTSFGLPSPSPLVVPGTSGPLGSPGATSIISWTFPARSSVVITAEGLASNTPTPDAGPDGRPESAVDCAIIPLAPLVTLIGQFGTGPWFVVGAGPIEITNPSSTASTLSFAINDCGNWADNSGSFNVYVTIKGTKEAGSLFDSAIQTYCQTPCRPARTARGRECMRRMQAAYCSTACPEYGKVQGLLCKKSVHRDYLFRVCQDYTNGPGNAARKGCPLDPNNLPWDDEPADRLCDTNLLNVRASGVFEDAFDLFERPDRDDDYDSD